MMYFIRLSLAILFIFSSCAGATGNIPGLHLDWIDHKVNPGVNFFAFANGCWQKKNPIPATYSSWGTLEIMQEQNLLRIKNLLEKNQQSSHIVPNSIEQKVTDFYYSGMDVENINRLGLQPIQAEFNRIDVIKNVSELQAVMIHFQKMGINTVFDFSHMQDFKNSNKVIGIASQSGITLPDPDYYLRKNMKFKRIREKYLMHVRNMFELLGDDKEKATKNAKTILKMETVLAKASLSQTSTRDPKAIYHVMDIASLQKITPHFSWQDFFKMIGHPEIKAINLSSPHYFKILDKEYLQFSISEWKTFLRWHLIHHLAPFLSTAFVEEDFSMSSLLTGEKKLLPRWKQVINAENAALGFAIGKLYVASYFPPTSKKSAELILNNIHVALKKDLESLSWMSTETRIAAIKKLDMMEARVGYPDQWLDYSPLTIDKGSYVLNIIRASEFMTKRDWDKIGKPVNKDEWDITPQEVNAYYDASMNRLNIPAGILQPPFFDASAPTSVNYGAIGFVMGHEMTHGFDDQGSKFDGKGNLNNWWNKKDLKKFQSITHLLSHQFSKYTIQGKVHLQGDLVIGEATADLGGLTLAWRAFHATDVFKTAKILDGYTPDQQFFLGAAHVWANNTRPEASLNLVITDPHPPAMYRVNGTLANMKQFQDAFNITLTQSPMINHQRTVIW